MSLELGVMAQFSYTAKAGPEEIKKGVIEAENKTVVIRKLKLVGLYPVSINEINLAPAKKSRQKIRSREISAFTRQLANLIHSGFSLATALSTLSQQETNPNVKKLLGEMHEKIQKGTTFSAVLALYPNSFSSFYINMANIGETSGKLDDALMKLADFKENEEELISQIKAALTYPSFVLAIGIITIFVVITFFIPRFVFMFADLGESLPLPTLIIMRISEFMSKYWGYFMAIAAIGVISARTYYKKEKNRLIVDNIILRLPLLKDIVQKIETARFAGSLGVLLTHGVPVLEALQIVILSVDNRVFRKKISSFQEKIKKGQNLSKCLQESQVFPPILVNMVAVGEEGGELNAMLAKIAGTFEIEVNRTVKTFVSLIEPILILAIGGIVALMAMSILLPILQINLAVK